MLNARRFAAALAIAGAGILAYAVPVSASPQPAHDGSGCVDGTDKSNLTASIDPATGNGTVTPKGTLCAPVDVLMSIYKVPDTWVAGSGFPGKDDSAVPQQVIQTVRGTVSGDTPLTLHVTVPACGNVQADVYYPPEIKVIDRNGTGPSVLLAGTIWQITPPSECVQHSTSPPPSHSPPPRPKPAPPPIVQPIPVPPAAPKPPQLAATGSNSTVPLVGLGAILLGAGIGLSLIGRRRTA
jgi:LPXTG-motif cell wall-anchored protein